MIRIEGGYLTFVVNGWDYEILLSQLKTKEGLQEWLDHLSEKDWFTADLKKTMLNMLTLHFNEPSWSDASI